MPTIQDQVAENRRNVQRVNSSFVSVPGRRSQGLSFQSNSITVEPSVEVYTRPLNDTLISGHPNGDQYGSGHGVSGDTRGDWTLRENVETSTVWVRGGRNAVRDSLAGGAGSVEAIAVGTDGSNKDSTAEALGTETGRTFAYGLRGVGEAENQTRARANFRYAEIGRGGLDPQEYGLLDSTGRLMGIVTTDAVPVSASEEVRVDITVTISGNGGGEAVVTENGEEAVAESIQLEGVTVGLDEMAWGIGTSTPTTTDTALDNEVFRKNVARSKDLEQITVSAPQFESEPTGQPYNYTEVGVYDNAGRLMWRTTMSEYTKTDEVRFTTSVTFSLS